MLKKTVRYKNFRGEDRVKDLYFAITSADGLRMILKESDIRTSDEELQNGFSIRVKNVTEHGTAAEIIDLFDELVKASYGEIEDDGETFNQSPEVYSKFIQTAAYKQFFEDLMTDTDSMIEFVNGIFPKEWREAAQEDPEYKRHRERLAQEMGKRDSDA